MLIDTIKRLTRTPLTHFLLAGLTIFLVQAQAPEPTRLLISESHQQRLADQWAQEKGTPPTPAQTRALINQAVTDEMLLDQARQRGLEELPVVQRRLAQLNKFLSTDTTPNNTSSSLALETTDPMVRQYLINAMRETLIAEAQRRERDNQVTISDAELDAYYQKHAADFTAPARYDLHHVYVGGLDERSWRRAQLISSKLDVETPLADALKLGDVFAEGHQLTGNSQQQLARRFGGEIADKVAQLPLHSWSQPIASGYGLHLIKLNQKSAEALRPLASVEHKIRREIHYAKRTALLNEQVERLKEHYVIDIQNQSRRLAARGNAS